MLSFRKNSVLSATNGAAAILAGLLVWELHAALVPAVPAPALGPMQAAPVIPAVPPADIAGLHATLLARPLFNPSRRPPPTGFPAAATVQMPRLSGIVITPTEKIAVFSPANGNPIIVTQNNQIGPFTVLSITRDRVIVQGPDGIHVLRARLDVPDVLDVPDDLDTQLIRIPLHSPAQ